MNNIVLLYYLNNISKKECGQQGIKIESLLAFANCFIFFAFFSHAQVQTKEHYLQWVNKLVNILKGQPHQAQQQQQQPQQPQLQQQVLTSSVTEPQPPSQPRAPQSVAAGASLTNEVSGDPPRETVDEGRFQSVKLVSSLFLPSYTCVRCRHFAFFVVGRGFPKSEVRPLAFPPSLALLSNFSLCEKQDS